MTTIIYTRDQVINAIKNDAKISIRVPIRLKFDDPNITKSQAYDALRRLPTILCIDGIPGEFYGDMNDVFNASNE